MRRWLVTSAYDPAPDTGVLHLDRPSQRLRGKDAHDGEEFVDDGVTVIVEGRTIVAVEPASHAVPADCPVVDHGQSTVLPRLIDTHVHLVGDSGPQALERVPAYPNDELDSVVTQALERHLASGGRSWRPG